MVGACADARSWTSKGGLAPIPGSTVTCSGLLRFFAAPAKKAEREGPEFLLVHTRELAFCYWGCYVSMADFRFAFRKTEAALRRAARTDAAIRSLRWGRHQRTCARRGIPYSSIIRFTAFFRVGASRVFTTSRQRGWGLLFARAASRAGRSHRTDVLS